MRIAFVGDSLTEGMPGCAYLAVLREALPEHELVNLGRCSDTVVSLHRRLLRLRFGAPFDMAFLWIGVNDVTVERPRLFELATALGRQPAARSLAEFERHYRAVLGLLCRHSGRVVAVSPAIKGEDLDSAPNRRCAELGVAIARITCDHPQAEFLDMRSVFAERLASRSTSGFLHRGLVTLARDALSLRGAERVDRVAAERGLHLTVDGVHLNSAGAALVAETFLARIRSAGAAACAETGAGGQ